MSGEATLYKGNELDGKAMSVYSGTSLPALGQIGWNDSISSIEVIGSETCLVVFKDKGYERSPEYFTEGTYEKLTDNWGGWGNTITSLHIFDSEVCDPSVMTTLYVNGNFSGGSMKLPVGYSASKISKSEDFNRDWRDKISSVEVGEGSCIHLFKDVSFSGTKLTLKSGDHPSLANYSFNDDTSSFALVSDDICPAEGLNQ
ncbi:hypothetical protein GCM10011369_05750 [Neiella marina]|uniref:Beta/gamma crystallin 'Greek key' domain-containing protein n=2 Tax=Neiella marina TaxID=508461 RepID=A0A8J2XNA7_9GAMM|nr:hypothetical protein GCM10011369_05750 [Neiella marina]